MTMGIVLVISFAARVDAAPPPTMTSTLRRTSSAANSNLAPIEFSVRKSRLNDNAFPLYIPKLAQTLAECREASLNRGQGGST